MEPKGTWTFPFTASPGDGVKTVSVTARDGYNSQGNCNTQPATGAASYTADNTGPAVTGTVSPAPNEAGWVRTSATVTWAATDAGSGISTGPTPTTTTVSSSTTGTGTQVSASATDRVGNTGSGSVTVRVDTVAPTVTATQLEAPGGETTITFTCSDAHSGISVCDVDGSDTTSLTVPGGTTVSASATDAAGNTTTATSTAPVRDTTPPVLTGTPRTSPNAAGWYSGDVVVGWSASDPESGVEDPADTVITGEGEGLTSTTSATNGVGLTATATSSPAVDIDRTPPTTTVTGLPAGWVDDTVTLDLDATDPLSGVASTSYSVDGAAPVEGSEVVLTGEGEHTVRFASTDRAGNVEDAREVIVRIDLTAPSITRSFTPTTYENGAWTNGGVTVTFTCDDEGGSGLTSCSGPRALTTEGVFGVVGTATDEAGNRADAFATVRIDTTAPEVTASPDRLPNPSGWFKDPVTVSFSATDGLSGVAEVTEDVTIGEGRGQSASGSATDAAGNTGSASVGGIDVDLTAPSLTGSAPEGWATDDVTVTWACADDLSGPAGTPEDSIVTGEGDDLSAAAVCSDVAGHETSAVVDGIRIDRTAPVTFASASGTPVSGWYSAPVEVTLTATDALSGVGSTSYTVDGSEPVAYTGPFTLTGDGTRTVTFHSTDVAGNVEEVGEALVVQIDTTDPETTVIDPQTPINGWFVTSGIPVAFEASDEGSGIAATYFQIDGGEVRTYGEPFTETLSDGPHTITYWSVDIAGNEEGRASVRGTVNVNVDTTAPTVTPADVVDTTWRNTPLSQPFAATDAGSLLAHPEDDDEFVLTASAESTLVDGTVVPTSVSRTVSDVAGNSTTRSLSALIDVTAPTGVAFVGGPVEGTRYLTSTVPAKPTCSATDALSGVVTCVVGGYSTGEGAHTLMATATDAAGNTATTTRSYTVRNYTLTGFSSPVDMNGVWNTIKGGNTVPLKFRAYDGGQQLTSTSAVASFTVIKVNCTSGAQDSVEVFTTTGATELRYDATGAQFIQNWKTPTGSGCYKVTMTLADGVTKAEALFRTNK